MVNALLFICLINLEIPTRVGMCLSIWGYVGIANVFEILVLAFVCITRTLEGKNNSLSSEQTREVINGGRNSTQHGFEYWI